MTALGLSDEQLAMRRRGIGGSDVAALLGLDPYRTAWDVWAEKTGRAEPSPENRFTRWGNRLEAVIADEYRERLGVALWKGATVVHAARPWQLGTPDRLVNASSQASAEWGLEIKARGLRQAWRWGAERDGAAGVPDEVQAQAHWYMSLTDLPRWDVAVLLDGNDFRAYTLERDTDVEAALLDVAERFWRDHVQANVPPDFDGGDAAWRYVHERMRGAGGKCIEPTVPAEMIASDLEEVLLTIERAEHRKAELRQRLAALAANLGVKGFANDAWRFVNVEQRGKVNWKRVAEVLLQEAKTSPERRAQLEEACRGRSYPAPRFTSRRLRDAGATDTEE